jgi:streptogramin lyase
MFTKGWTMFERFRKASPSRARAKVAYSPCEVRPLEGRALLSGGITRFPLDDSNINALAAGPDGKVWFGDTQDFGNPFTTSPLGRISPSGSIDRVALPPNVGQVNALTVGPDGNMWFGGTQTTPAPGVIGRVTPAGAVSLFDVPGFGSVNGFGSVDTIARGPDGNLVFSASNATDSGNEVKVGRVSTTGAVTLLPVTLSNTETNYFSSAAVTGLAVDGQGNIWVAFNQEDNSAAGSVGKLDRISPGGQLTEFTLPVVRPKPSRNSAEMAKPFKVDGITTSPDGNIWVTESTDDFTIRSRIVRVTPSGHFTSFQVTSGAVEWQPAAITPGPGGKLYFSIRDVNADVPAPQEALGTITTSGRVSIIRLPNSKKAASLGLPTDNADGPLAIGPDGNLYFTNNFGPSVERIGLAPRAKAKA